MVPETFIISTLMFLSLLTRFYRESTHGKQNEIIFLTVQFLITVYRICKYFSWLAAVVHLFWQYLILDYRNSDVCQHPSILLFCKPLPEAERGYLFIRARESTQSKLNRLQAAKRLLMCLGKRSKQSFCVCCFHCSLFRALFSLS